MALNTRFSEQEQIELSALPSLVGAAMIVAAGSGLGTIKEIITNSRTLIKGAKYYKSNAVIQDILPVYDPASGTGEDVDALRRQVKQYIKSHEVESKQQMRELALEVARNVNAVLFQKATPLETDQYKSWLLEIAEEVALAAKEGSVLGFGGERVSPGEKDFFSELAAAMHPVRTDAKL